MSGFVSTEIRLVGNRLLETTLYNPGEVGDVFNLSSAYYRIVKKYSFSTYVNHVIVEKATYLDFILKQYPHILTRRHPFLTK